MRRQQSRAASAWTQAIAGLAAAWIVGGMLCDLPASHHLSGKTVLLLAAKYVLLTLLAGIAQVWAFRALFDRQYEFTSRTLIFHAGAAWLLVAPIALLMQKESIWMAVLMALGAVLMTAGMRRMVPALPVAQPAREAAILSGPLKPEPWPWLAFGLSIGIYAGMVGIHTQFLFSAGVLLATCVAVFLWRMTSVNVGDAAKPDPEKAPSALRVISAVVAAILLTAWILTPWLRSQNLYAAAGQPPPKPAPPRSAHDRDSDAAYRGIILWPAPPKKEDFVAPRPETIQAGSKSKPFIIPFDGAYWYYQLPASGPGARAHRAYGTPVGVNIRAKDLLPLLMEAHQELGSLIDLSCCREIEVSIQNGDNHAGAIQLGLLLTDTTLPGKPSQYLGTQPVVSSLPGHFSLKPSPVSETLRFPVPIRSANIHRFNAITVIYMPASQRSIVGAKINIGQFELLPR